MTELQDVTLANVDNVLLNLKETSKVLREEHFETIVMGRIWKARWVWLRGLWSFWAAVGMDIPLSVIGLIRKIWVAAN